MAVKKVVLKVEMSASLMVDKSAAVKETCWAVLLAGY